MTATEWFMKAQIQQLEEENKKLKDKIEHLEFDIEAWKKLKAVWEKKEQKLQIEIWWLMWERDGLKMAVDKLKEENQTLELWLDNKEKLNEEYRKQIDKLKSDLSECECSFWFESDEVWYRKREAKRLWWKPNN